jgi:hypothetical protein
MNGTGDYRSGVNAFLFRIGFGICRTLFFIARAEHQYSNEGYQKNHSNLFHIKYRFCNYKNMFYPSKNNHHAKNNVRGGDPYPISYR